MHHDRQTEFMPRGIWKILLAANSDHYADFNDFSGFTGLRPSSVPMMTKREGGLPVLPVRFDYGTGHKSL